MSKLGRQKGYSNLKTKLTREPDDDRTKRITLRDLCPQQKAKVGELMQLMQNEKVANQKLQAELKQQLQKNVLLQEHIEQLKLQIAELQSQNQSNRLLVLSVNKQLQTKSKQYSELVASKQASTLKRQCIAQSVQTSVVVINRQTQTQKIANDAYCQTVILMDQWCRGKSHSIKESVEMVQIDTYPQQRLPQEQQYSRSKVTLPLHPFKNEGYLMFDQLVDERQKGEASELAKAWIDMKKWSIQKMKRDLKRKKKQIHPTQLSNSHSDDSIDRSCGSSHPQREKRLLQAIHKLKLHNADPLQNGSGKQSRNLHKVSIHQASISSQNENQMDQDTLNKLLKSHDFKASRLVKSSSKIASHQNSKKKTVRTNYYDSQLLDLIEDLN